MMYAESTWKSSNALAELVTVDGMLTEGPRTGPAGAGGQATTGHETGRSTSLSRQFLLFKNGGVMGSSGSGRAPMPCSSCSSCSRSPRGSGGLGDERAGWGRWPRLRCSQPFPLASPRLAFIPSCAPRKAHVPRTFRIRAMTSLRHEVGSLP